MRTRLSCSKTVSRVTKSGCEKDRVLSSQEIVFAPSTVPVPWRRQQTLLVIMRSIISLSGFYRRSECMTINLCAPH